MLEGASTVEVATRLHGECCRFLPIRGHLMELVEVADCPAVAHDIAIELPLLPQDLHEQRLTTTTHFTVGSVVGTHDATRLGFGDAGVKCGKISLAQIFLAHPSIEAVT